MVNLGQVLVENLIAEIESEGVTILLPGGFKPPHGGHLELAKRYASDPTVKEVQILIGPKERDGFTRDHSIAVWKLLLANNPKIKVFKVQEDNPLLASYKYIETAKPGTYALAASSKGEDYERVKKFVAGHAKGGKYNRKGVEVIELGLDTKPLLYKDRSDSLNNKGISASTLRADIKANNFINFKSNYPGVSDDVLKRVYQILTKKKIREVVSLQEGGGAGHLAHPYEDYDLTFEDIENMIVAALSGTVDSAQEKLDGQNFMVTYKDGQVRAARNKGQIKDFGANSLTLKQVEDMFAGRGNISTAFTEAMVDLKSAIERLTPAQKQKFFNNGSKFINMEVLFPATTNVIPYGATQLRIHHIKEYDKAGNVVGEDIESAKQLEGAIRQIEAQNQKTYEIRVTDPLTIKKSTDYKKQKNELLTQLATVMSSYKLKKGDLLGSYVKAWWKNYIKGIAKSNNYNIPDIVLDQLVARWGMYDKSVNIRTIRDSIDNESFKNWMVNFDKGDYAVQNKIAIKPIENLFLKLGVYTLGNIENLIAINPNDSTREIKSNLKDAISNIKQAAANGDQASLAFLKRELQRLKDIGGYKAILPTEGIVYKYNGKLYKLTGAFAPINQILGYLKF